VRVLGQFPKEADDTLIPLTSIEAATSRGSDPTPAHRSRNASKAILRLSKDRARKTRHPELDSGSLQRATTPPPDWGRSRGGDCDAATKDECPPGANEQEREAAALPELSDSVTIASNGDCDSATQDECPPGANSPLPAERGELERGINATLRPRTYVRPEPITIGVDIARFGTDRTVICARQGSRVIELNQYAKLNTMQTVGKVVDAITRHNPESVNVDEVGIGAGVVDRLHELGHSNVTGINVGAKSTDPEHFFNLRAELYDALRTRFEQGDIEIPNDADLIAQLAAIRVEFTSRGQLKVESKETMRRRSLPSPDKADALLLAFAPTTTHHQPNFKIWL
jgi:hypothetical protein